MDKKTLEYMSTRVGESKDLTKQIKDLQRQVDELCSVSREVYLLYHGKGRRYELPWSVRTVVSRATIDATNTLIEELKKQLAAL